MHWNSGVSEFEAFPLRPLDISASRRRWPREFGQFWMATLIAIKMLQMPENHGTLHISSTYATTCDQILTLPDYISHATCHIFP
jgi:hypothetical protein